MGTFEDVYRLHVQAVFRFAMSIARNRESAEDLTSEAFLALYRNFSAIEQSQLPGWLLAVVRNRARDGWRRQMVEQKHAGELARATGGSQPPALEDWILQHEDLKPVHRTCLMLRYAHGMTRAEIASSLGIGETQVKGYLQYGLTLLRKAFAAAESS